MWSSVTSTGVENGPAPPSRSKHSATLLAGHLYLLGGRNGNLPLKDLWRYSFAENRWEALHPSGDKPPALQEHSAVAYKDRIYVFGGELGFSAGNETPLWYYSIKTNSWKKIRAQKGCVVPRGRRGHSALVHRGQMLIYGGYQDLRGSCSELWAFHFETESWHLLSNDVGPPARHKHSAVLHDDSMYIYGGMTDLQERSDCWKWDVKLGSWCMLKSKVKNGPGPLHGHAACRLPSCMLIFGGESGGLPTNELWRFHFGTQTWEKLTVLGPKPQPRAESVALAVSELLFRGNDIDNNSNKHGTGNSSSNINSSLIRSRLKSQRNKLNLSRVSPCDTPAQRTSFFREISKLSQINLSRLSHPNKCSYSVLNGYDDHDIESTFEVDIEVIEPATGMVKSRSSGTIARRNKQCRMSDPPRASMIEPMLSNLGMTREPISVPNFRALALPTPVLTPVEAARLVFVDPDEDTDDEEKIINSNKNIIKSQLIEVPKEEKRNFASVHQACQPGHRENYSLHIYDTVQTPKIPCMKLSHSNSVRFADLEEGEESTSDYASIGARSPGDPLADEDWPLKKPMKSSFKWSNNQNPQDGQFGFCNPNYLVNADIRAISPVLQTTSATNHDDGNDNLRYAKMLNSPPDSLLEDEPGRSASQTFAELLELQEMKPRAPPKSLPLGSPSRRAVSASRAERQRAKLAASEHEKMSSSSVPIYVFLVGGKEKGQVTVFARPVSLWRLELEPHIF